LFESRVLRRIFGSRREEVAGHWRRLRNEELHNFYAPPDVIMAIKPSRMELAGNVASMRNLYRIFVGKYGVNRPLE